MSAVQQLLQLREAVNTLYCSDVKLQQAADKWLQDFQSGPGAWQLCVQLLDTPGFQDHESYFAANSIKAACQKHQDVLVEAVARELLQKLAQQIEAHLRKQHWAIANQLAAATALLIVRAPVLQPGHIVQDLPALFLSAATAAATEMAHFVPVSANIHNRMQHAGHSQLSAADAEASSYAALLQQAQQHPVAYAALLTTLAALPDALLTKRISVHPDRRAAVTEGLQSSLHSALLLRAGLCSNNSTLAGLACQAIAGWCELGVAPKGIELYTDALAVLVAAVVHKELHMQACDAVTAMLGTCATAGSSLADTAGNTNLLLQQLLQQLHADVLQPLAKECQQMQSSSNPNHSSNGQAMHEQSYMAAVKRHLGSEAEQAFCQVLCAAGAASLRPALSGNQQLQAVLVLLLQELLVGMHADEDAIVMTAFEFWQDSYTAFIQYCSKEQQALLVQQQHSVLESLAAALIARTQLPAAVAAAASADSRDLPDKVHTMRRELAVGLRDLTTLLGPAILLNYTVQLVHNGLQALSTGTAADAGNSSTVHQAAVSSWVALEGALYAVNVVLGVCGDQQAELSDQVQQLVHCASDSVTHPAGSLKLSGTALTLLGGLSTWLANHPDCLQPVLASAAAALRSPDAKLSRNAATCLQRLTSWTPLAQMLVHSGHPGFVELLMQQHHKAWQQDAHAGDHTDDEKSTSELLMATLTSLMLATGSMQHAVSVMQQLTHSSVQAATAELGSYVNGSTVHKPHAAIKCFGSLRSLVACINSQSHPTKARDSSARQQQQRRQKQQWQQQQQLNATAAAKGRGVVTQLLVGTSQLLTLAMQAASMAACQHHQVQLGQQLLAASCTFLGVAFSAVLAHPEQVLGCFEEGTVGSVDANSNAVPPGATVFGTHSSSSSPSDGNMLQAAVLLQQVYQLFDQVPDQLLQHPCCWRLLGSTIADAAVAGLLPPAACLSAMGLTQHAQEPSTHLSQQQQQQQQQWLSAQQCQSAQQQQHLPLVQQQLQLQSLLQGLIAKALTAACAAMQQHGAISLDQVLGMLALGAACLQHTPGLLVPQSLDVLLAVILPATRSQNSEQCIGVLRWIETLVKAAQLHHQHQQGAGGIVAHCTTNMAGQTLEALQQRLVTAGVGPQLVLASLLAAAGSMPPDLILPICRCLHGVLVAAGQQLFRQWLHESVLQLAADTAPWQSVKIDTKVAFIGDLSSGESLASVTRFKRLVKQFCGGKKKGTTSGMSVRAP